VFKYEKTIEGHTLRLDYLTTRIAVLKKAVGISNALDTLKVKVSTLRAEVD